MQNNRFDAGLENVVAAETRLSDVDGPGGRLVIRGYPVEELALHARFEEALALLWQGLFSEPVDARSAFQALGEARALAFARFAGFSSPASLDDVSAFRARLALLDDGETLAHAYQVVAAGFVAAAATIRAARGAAPVAPDPALSCVADFLRMVRGAPASQREIEALEAYLVTVCDHGLNASTFASRVTASTRAGLISSVLAGVSALKGPLHGGAPGPVLDMLDAIGAPENAQAWIDDALARGERLMGFGHRIYRARDPRADALKTALARLGQGGARLALAEAIEQVALARLRALRPGRPLEINVEFYTAVLLDALDLPRTAFTCLFACGRSLGWVAHAREQVLTNRLVRPRSTYVGPAPSVNAAA